MSKTMDAVDLRTFALIGAKARLLELENATKELKDTIRLLQQAGGKHNYKQKKSEHDREHHRSNGGRARGIRVTKRTRRKHSDAYKAKVVAEAQVKGIAVTAKKHTLARSLVDKWVARDQSK